MLHVKGEELLVEYSKKHETNKKNLKKERNR